MFPSAQPWRIIAARGSMKREKLSDEAVETFLRSHPGWERSAEAITKRFTFDDYPAAMAFAVRVGFAAEKKNHHPDLQISWGKVVVAWSTHDAGGITALDIVMADLTDRLHGG